MLVIDSCTRRNTISCAGACSCTGCRLQCTGMPAACEKPAARFCSVGTRPSWRSDAGCRFSAMLRCRAITPSSAVTRCTSRSSTSGGWPDRRLRMRAASSLAAVSRAPSSSCRSRARRARSSSRVVCRCWVSATSSAVRSATSASSVWFSAWARRWRSACCWLMARPWRCTRNSATRLIRLSTATPMRPICMLDCSAGPLPPGSSTAGASWASVPRVWR